eukprot:2824740-Pleurochrysis_carterae.AAC.1
MQQHLPVLNLCSYVVVLCYQRRAFVIDEQRQPFLKCDIDMPTRHNRLPSLDSTYCSFALRQLASTTHYMPLSSIRH